MKKSRIISLLAATVFAPFMLAAAPVDSRISAVTVYTDRAVVTRTATVNLTGGVAELVFANLPQTLNEQSLQVSGKGTAQALILDVSAKKTYVDFTPNARVKELEDQLRTLGKQVREIDDQGNVLQAQGVMLDRMEAALFAPPTKDVPRPELEQFTSALTYLTEQKSRLTTTRATLDEQREVVQNQINTVQRQLNELRGAGGKSYKTVTVRVSAEQAGNLQVSLSYTVPGATWSPNYDARVLSADRAVELGYFGLVRQNTGEDWQDVALTLSTARPGLGGAAPDLGVWNLDVFVPRPAPVAYDARQERAKNMAMPMVAGAMSREADQAMELKDAGMAAATIEAGATSASFKITVASSIPSDNSPQKVPITSARLNVQSEYNTTPKLLANAYLTSRVYNNTEFPLLAGGMNVFLDGTFVATSRMHTVMPGERFELALGADEGISVKHQRIQKFAEETGVFSKDHRLTYEYLITIQNNKRTSERVIVNDQVPVSRNEKIVVKVLAPAEKDVKPDAEGKLKWTLDLKPGEKRELTVKFTIDYPMDVNISGLE
ncbi:MAG: mucoidy inhibitor MuiA family protein [Cephaloticoccus sp.]|nr:mucoidy inhibitor MuiA family protein [Cephaloticoccus sp.]MCF7759353.1 mucoidy inhibitor MuiA family protein [Cephaloticoccus sp.]